MIYIAEIPAGLAMTDEKALGTCNIPASGITKEDCLTNLVSAINADEVDSENCFLRIIETKD